MNIRHIIAGALCLLVAPVVLAQTPQKDIPITVRVITTYATDLDEAILLSDSACLHSPESTHHYAWYARAFVYKEKFKRTDSLNIYSPWRETALLSLRKSMELDTKGENATQVPILLEYLSNTYHAQLSECLDFFTPLRETDCGMLWNKFEETQQMLGNEERLIQHRKDYYFTFADRHMVLYEQNPALYAFELEKAFECYTEILKMDPLDYKANYNTAIYYYNQGVTIIGSFNESTTLEELIALQESSIGLFRKSLPFMLKAQELRPDRQETLKGLYIIYRALSEEDKSFFYKSELEKLIKSGGTNPLKWETNDE